MKVISLFNDSIKILISILGLLLASRISFDLPPSLGIPITGQSFAILIIGYFLPWRLALISVIIYLICGVLGLPVFANGSGGLDILIGKTGGYLFGFLPAVYILSKWEFGQFNNLAHTLQSLLFSTAIILFCGFIRLSMDLGLPMAIEYGIKPFWVGAVFKVLLALLVIFFYLKINRKL